MPFTAVQEPIESILDSVSVTLQKMADDCESKRSWTFMSRFPFVVRADVEAEREHAFTQQALTYCANGRIVELLALLATRKDFNLRRREQASLAIGLRKLARLLAPTQSASFVKNCVRHTQESSWRRYLTIADETLNLLKRLQPSNPHKPERSTYYRVVTRFDKVTKTTVSLSTVKSMRQVCRQLFLQVVEQGYSLDYCHYQLGELARQDSDYPTMIEYFAKCVHGHGDKVSYQYDAEKALMELAESVVYGEYVKTCLRDAEANRQTGRMQVMHVGRVGDNTRASNGDYSWNVGLQEAHGLGI